MKKILFIGHSGFRNRGCEAIVRGSIEIIKHYIPESKITLFSRTPEFDLSTIRKSGIEIDEVVPSVLSGFKKPSVKWLGQTIGRRFLSGNVEFQDYLHRHYYQETDVVISIGGDNFSEDYGSPKQFFESLRYAKKLGKKTVIWGASIGPFKHDIEQWSAILKSCDLITVREDNSLEYLKTLGCSGNIRRVSDPAFCMVANPPSEVNKFIKDGKVIIGLGVSDLICRYDFSRDQYNKMFADFITYLCSTQQAHVFLVPHVIYPNKEYLDDLNACQKVMALLSSNVLCQVLPGILNATEFKHCISQFDYFIGARTHSTIASLSTHVPTGSIGYSVKATGINIDLLGTDQYVLSLSDLSLNSLIELYEKMKTNQSTIVQRLIDEVPHAKERALKAGKELAEIIGN